MSNTFLRLDDYNVPGYGLTVRASMEIKTQETSGETCSTGDVDKGIKPKTLEVSLNIRFSNADDLKELTRKAEAKSDDGSMATYTITNMMANAMGIRQAKFSGTFRANEMDGARAWIVSFTLKEQLSIPELQEQREAEVEAVAQTSDGATVTQEDTAGLFGSLLATVAKGLE